MRSLLFLLISFGIPVFAQQYPFYEHYELEEDPVTIERPPSDQIYYYNKYLLTVEYEYDYFSGSFYKYETIHYRVKLNKDAAIDEFNKVYISMEDVVRVMKVEARVIKEDEILEVPIEMEDFYSEDEDEQYSYFPIAGLELGDEVEIRQTLKMQPMVNGDQFYFQGEMPIYDFDFRFIAPNDSYFNFLAQNGLPEPVLIDTILQRHQYDIHLDTVAAFKSEYFSEFNNVIMKLDASLKGSDDGAGDYSPYASFVDYANEVFNQPLSGKDKKFLDRKLTELEVSRMNPQITNIRKIENYMKNEFLIGYGTPGMSIKDMLQTGRGNGTGSLKLFFGLLNQANIPYEFGLLSDRYDTQFSEEIESDYFLQEYFIYFPEAKTYLAPLDFYARVGYMDYDWVPNKGLYLQPKQYPVRKVEHSVKPIGGTTAEENRDSTVIIINVDQNLVDTEIFIERHISGYDAGEHQVIYDLYTESKKKKVHDDLLDVFKDNSTYKMTSIKHTSAEDAFYRPLIIKGKVTTLHTPLIEKAGKRTIFRLGEIFGEYIDPKEVKRKKSHFTFSHPIWRVTTVVINFPEQMKVANPEVVESFEKLTEQEGIHISATFNVEGNTLTYTQRDIYKYHTYSLDAKEDMVRIFEFHNDLRKINLVIE